MCKRGAHDARCERVVITGASRGLGLASAVRLCTRTGWRVVAAMRSVDAGLERLRARDRRRGRRPAPDRREARPRRRGVDRRRPQARSWRRWAPPTSSCTTPGSPRRAPSRTRPPSTWDRIFATNCSDRSRSRGRSCRPCAPPAAAGSSSSRARARCAACPRSAAYSASKGAIERWAESLAGEVAPFGLGVTIVVAGTFKTDILVQTADYRNYQGPYAQHYVGIDKTGDIVIKARESARAIRARARQGASDRATLLAARGRYRRHDAHGDESASAGMAASSRDSSGDAPSGPGVPPPCGALPQTTS